MAEHITEEEQVEAFKKWWKDNGSSVITGALIAFGGLFGWNYWQGQTQTHLESASAVYAHLISNLDADKQDVAAGAANELLEKYADTPYATQAALALAKLAVRENDLELARAQLNNALKQPEPAELAHLIRYRLARVLAAEGKHAEALAELRPDAPDAYLGMYAELKGDILVAMGDAEAARKAYAEALEKADGNNPNLKMKLDDLAVKETVASAEAGQ